MSDPPGRRGSAPFLFAHVTSATPSFRRTRLVAIFLALSVGGGACGNDPVEPAGDEPEQPVPGPSSWSAVATGYDHTCALLSDGRAFCWGDNVEGQAGVGAHETVVASPTEVAGGHRFASVTAGEAFTCGLTVEGRLRCWGNNQMGQLGDGTAEARFEPTTVAPDPGFLAVSAGSVHACAITAAGAAYCWGGGGAQKPGRLLALGYPPPDTCVPLSPNYHSTSCSHRPRPASEGLELRTISAGLFHTCAAGVSGRAYCWGSDEWSQMGLGDEGPGSTPEGGSATPVRVGESFGPRALSAGHTYTCGIGADGHARCWGLGAFADGVVLGLGALPRTSEPEPVRVAGDARYGTIVSNRHNHIFALHTCAITLAGGVHCWGSNEFGQLGFEGGAKTCDLPSGTVPCTGFPTPIALPHEFVGLDVGRAHTCAVTDDGVLYCWGANDRGQLGVAGVSMSAMPLLVETPG